METNTEVNKISNWKKFEKLLGVIAGIAAIAGILGVYYQIHTKSTKIEFQIISKDYLTSNNNIDGLKSNFEYEGFSVKNLWLLKIKLINTGDVTLFGKGDAKSILDSNLIFYFNPNLQVLNKIDLISTNLPDQNLSLINSTTLSFNFQQWRKNEYAIYSLYIKSDTNNISLLPTSKRIIKEGDIYIFDLTNNQIKLKQPLLDIIFKPTFSLIGRILSFLFVFLIFILSTILIFKAIFQWFVYLKWKKNNYQKFNAYILKLNESEIKNDVEKIVFKRMQNKYAKNPLLLPFKSSIWKNFDGDKIPEENTLTNWKEFWKFILILIGIYLAIITTILGLWIY